MRALDPIMENYSGRGELCILRTVKPYTEATLTWSPDRAWLKKI